MKLLHKIVSGAVFATSLLVAVPTYANDVLTFGVVPQQAANKLARNWGPIFSYLSQRSGLNIKFATAPDIPEFERRLANGEYDIAYMNPYHYTVFGDKPGYVAIAKQKDKSITGILVARKDTDLTAIEQLQGNLAFPAPAAFAASILTRSALHEAGVIFDPKYVKSHDSVYRAVAKGLFAAGGGVVRTFNNTEDEIRDQLKIFWRSNKYTPHAIAVHPRLDISSIENLQAAMLVMADDPQGAELLKAINFKGFMHADYADWDDVRALRIDLLKDL